MKSWDEAGGVRLPEQANSFPNSNHVLASPLPRCNRGGMCAILPCRVTRETSELVSLANWLVGHISESEIGRLGSGGVGAGSSSNDGKDSITYPERRTRTLEMFCRAKTDWHEFLCNGGSP